MTMTATDALKIEANALFLRKRMMSFGLPVVVMAYLTYIFFSFDVLGLSTRFDIDNARALVADSYSYKTHVTRDNRSGEVTIAIEGERKGTYAAGVSPDWVSLANSHTDIDLGGGHVVTFGQENLVSYAIPEYGVISAQPGAAGVRAQLPTGDVPSWINVSKNRLTVTTDEGRLTVTRNRTEVFRYFMGWELFFFTLDSPYHGMGFFELAGHALNGEATAIWHDFWTNKMWRHADVAWAIFETILMAFLGTMGAAIVALPMAFLAAKNFTPLMIVRQATRRLFDFFRGVDALIWTIVLARAFGPGPLTGALAILITDTGSFGKMFSEALENVDQKQIEGIQSTGAKPLQRDPANHARAAQSDPVLS